MKESIYVFGSQILRFLYILEIDMSVESNRENVYGSALGPDWSTGLPIKGASKVYLII